MVVLSSCCTYRSPLSSCVSMGLVAVGLVKMFHSVWYRRLVQHVPVDVYVKYLPITLLPSKQHMGYYR